MGVTDYHMMSLQIYDLSIVKRYSSIGFSPEQVNIETAFVEFSKFACS